SPISPQAEESDSDLSAATDSSAGDTDSEMSSDGEGSVSPEIEEATRPDLSSQNRPWQQSSAGPDEDRRKFRTCQYFVRGRCKKGEMCPYKHDTS
ncbi:hypothetical protein EV182_008102, partial [Spiromyces aspiralis]